MSCVACTTQHPSALCQKRRLNPESNIKRTVVPLAGIGRKGTYVQSSTAPTPAIICAYFQPVLENSFSDRKLIARQEARKSEQKLQHSVGWKAHAKVNRTSTEWWVERPAKKVNRNSKFGGLEGPRKHRSGVACFPERSSFYCELRNWCRVLIFVWQLSKQIRGLHSLSLSKSMQGGARGARMFEKRKDVQEVQECARHARMCKRCKEVQGCARRCTGEREVPGGARRCKGQWKGSTSSAFAVNLRGIVSNFSGGSRAVSDQKVGSQCLHFRSQTSCSAKRCKLFYAISHHRFTSWKI
jgi:hypothetical protein